MVNWIQLLILNAIFFIKFAESIDFKRFSYPNFSEGDEDFFKFQGSSSIYNGALQLTPETINPAFMAVHFNKSGQVMYPEPFKLWSSSSSSSPLASFNTSFVINIYRNSDWDAGNGLAFLIAPNASGLPDSSYGRWLGLTNSSTDSNPSNHIVAVEFDTQTNGGDAVDGDHVGINLNSVVSETSAALSDFNITLSPPPPGANYSVWIDYNGTIQVMQIYMAREGIPKPRNPILSHSLDLRKYLKQESYFGFAASTGDPQIELNCVLKWSFQIENLSHKNKQLPMKIGIGVGVGIPFLIAITVIALCIRRKNLKSAAAEGGGGAEEEEAEIGNKVRWLPGMAREFRYEELKLATSDFDEKLKLGEGGFGVVYKGVIQGTETEIAVKKFSRDNVKGRKDDFLAELQIIHRLRHKHLVRLVGWCYEKGELLLVYDYMPNGSLEKYLYEVSPELDTLDWTRRVKVLTGVASALHYLHNEYDQVVIHRDLKSSNILLDKDFNARLGDFGLARALENEKNSYAELGFGGVAGTFGYVAPECFHTGKATPESDVFSFGAIILEVVCGKGPGNKIHHNQHLYSLVDWVWMLHREGRILEAVDERVKDDFNEDEAKRLLLLGLACSHPIQSSRPKTKDVVQIISGDLPAPKVPPFRPVFMWPSMSNPDNGDSSLSGISLSTQNSLRSSSLSKLQL